MIRLPDAPGAVTAAPMGDIIRFPGRKKKSWTRPQDYGHRPGKPPGAPRPPRRPLLSGLRPWVLLIALLTAWKFYDPMLMEPPAFLSSDPETVNGTFARCDGARATRLGLGDGAHAGLASPRHAATPTAG